MLTLNYHTFKSYKTRAYFLPLSATNTENCYVISRSVWFHTDRSVYPNTGGVGSNSDKSVLEK